MIVIRDVNKLNTNTNTSVALGNFDGLHIGHKELIKTLVRKSRENNTKSLVFTFQPHPLKVLLPDTAPKIITSLEEKIKLMQRLKVDILALVKFTNNFSKMSPREFVDKILLKQLKAQLVVVGYDFTFGYKGRGNPEYLIKQGKQKGFRVIVIPPIKLEGITVSSTHIRDLISRGEIHLANKLLGHRYRIEGKVISGKGIGRKLGFPTANISFDSEKILPKKGVYAVKVKVRDKIYSGVVNIGRNPTVKSDKINVEVHIIGFKEFIYGEKIELIFYKFLRNEKKFKTLKELEKRIRQDVEKVKRYFSRYQETEKIDLFTN